MAASRYADALEGYRDAARTTVIGTRGRAVESAVAPAGDESLLIRSQELEDAAAQGLASGDGDVRELAALQLAGSAALDVATALDLLGGPPPRAAEAAVSGSSFDAVYAELRDVLEAPTALGARAAAPAPAKPSAAEAGAEPLAALGLAAGKAIDDIGGDARTIAKHGIDGLVALPGDVLLGAFTQAADKLVGPLAQGLDGVVRLAVRHLAKAVSKLLRLLGPLERPARKWLEKTLSGLAKDALARWAVDGALELERVRADVVATIEGADAGADDRRVDAGRKELAALSARFGRHERVIGVLARVLDKLRGVLLGLAAWAGAAIAGVYVLMLSYGIWVAGDFVDWYRTQVDGTLDFVAGVRTTVRLAVAA
jgi:hypothetical protein